MTIVTPVVLLERINGVAYVRMNRPQALNAINPELATALHACICEAAGDTTVRVIVLGGIGRAFCAGGDLRYFKDAGGDAPAAARALIKPIHAAVKALADAPQPVIAELQGAVAGAGMSLALAADLAIAAEDAVFALAYSQIGATPDCSASWTLPRMVGMRKAMELALLGDRFDAAQALRLHLVNECVTAAALSKHTAALAQRLAGMAPLALQGIKRLVRQSWQHDLRAQLDLEEESFVAMAASADFQDALSAFFEKRPAEFRGR